MELHYPITPHPMQNESALGWTLRLSESNFLPSPWALFQLAKIDQRGITSPAFDPSILCSNIPAKLLRGLSYRDKRANRLFYQFRKQSIGARELSLRKPKICSQCVNAHGVIDAFWDISLVTTCPLHGRELTQRCPHCGNDLSWFRPGRLICRCGASLVDVIGEEEPHALVLLHSRLRQVAFAKSDEGKRDSAIQDLGPFKGASLRFSLRLIRTLGMFSIFGHGNPDMFSHSYRRRMMMEAADILANWPNNFFQFLDRLAKRPPRPYETRQGLLSYLDDFLDSLFGKPRNFSDGRAVYDGISQFLTKCWDGAVGGNAASSFLNEEQKPRWISLSAAAEGLNVDRRTLERIIRDQSIGHRTQKNGARTSWQVLTEDLKKERFGPVDLLGVREAAGRIGLPVSILCELRRTGEYVQSYFGPWSDRYAAHDVDAFAEKMWLKAELCASNATQAVTLSKAMRIKLRSVDAKAAIVRAVINGTIRAYGVKAGNVKEMLLNRDDFDRFIERGLYRGEKLLPISQAARTINMDVSVFADLIKKKAIPSESTEGEAFVRTSHAMRFREIYLDLTRRLHYNEGAITRAIQVCNRQGVDCIKADGSVTTYFILKRDFSLIAADIFLRKGVV